MLKTEGNRTEQETRDLDGMLHELRMAFVAVKQAMAAKTGGGRRVSTWPPTWPGSLRDPESGLKHSNLRNSYRL